MRKNDGLGKKKKNFFFFICIFTSGRFCLTPGSAGFGPHFREAPGWSGRVHMYVNVPFKILQTRLRSYSVGSEMWLFVSVLQSPILCERTVKASARMRGWTGSTESSLFANVISTLFSIPALVAQSALRNGRSQVQSRAATYQSLQIMLAAPRLELRLMG